MPLRRLDGIEKRIRQKFTALTDNDGMQTRTQARTHGHMQWWAGWVMMEALRSGTSREGAVLQQPCIAAQVKLQPASHADNSVRIDRKQRAGPGEEDTSRARSNVVSRGDTAAAVAAVRGVEARPSLRAAPDQLLC